MEERLRTAISQEFDVQHLEALTRQINAFEKRGTYSGYARSAAFCADELRRLGLEGVELINLPADGETTFMDFTIPQAWEAEAAELAVVEPADAAQALIDYAAMPLNLANRCAPTPPEGVLAEVISVEELYARSNAAGVLVYTAGKLAQSWRPEENDPPLSARSLRTAAAAKGALGFISDYSPAVEMDPEATYWINGWGSPGWYQTKDDTPLVCYSISPARGAVLAGLLARGPVKVQARVKSRLYDGSIGTVTALLPGRQAKEIVLMAHIYEPFLCDDAVGAAAVIEIGRTLKALLAKGELPPLEFGIRLLIGMERYGFAAYFSDAQARDRALLGINMDAINLSQARTGAPLEIRCSAQSLPFWGDFLLSHLAQRDLAEYPTITVPGSLSDDTFISDRTIGIPSQWVWTRVGATHHSSMWFEESFNDWPKGAAIARLIAAYTSTMAAAAPSEQAGF
ncbi:MAG: zinc-binding metallopeptidase family protein, partial [Anaerolineae bacterium]